VVKIFKQTATMKNVTTRRKLRLLPTLIAFVAITFAFSACNKDDNDFPNTQAAGLMAFNLAPDQNAVSFSISGNLLTNQPLAFTNFTGAYLSIYPGTRLIESKNATSGRQLDSASATFETGKYYSTFLVGADSVYKNIIVQDKIDTLTAPNGQAFIRYVNAISDPTSPAVNITANGTSIFNDPAAFGAVSEFKEVTPGSVTIGVSNEGNINKTRTIDVTSKKIYTVLLLGKPGVISADSLQIRFIENGLIN
jgi:hypothetical protein